jgi:hypothetical protein
MKRKLNGKKRKIAEITFFPQVSSVSNEEAFCEP